MATAVAIVAAASLCAPVEGQGALSRSESTFEDLRQRDCAVALEHHGEACRAVGAIGDLPFSASSNSCGFDNTLSAYGGACTLQGIGFPGPEAVYSVTLTAGNSVSFSLDLAGSEGDLVLVLVGECGDGSSCVINSPDFIGVGIGPEEIPAASYPPGTYYLYVDSFLPLEDPASCGSFRLSATGTNRPETDLGVVLSAVPDPVPAGSRLVYTLEVTNDSPFVASEVVARASLPPGTGLVSAPDDCIQDPASQITCRIGDLGAFDSASRPFAVAVSPSFRGVLTSTATVAGRHRDPDGNNNTSAITVPVIGQVALLLEHSDSPDPALAGTELRYTLKVANAGPSVATGVVLTESLPAGVSVVSFADGCRAVASRTVICNVGNLAVDARVARSITVAIDPEVRQPLTSVARADATETDPISVAQTTRVRAVADLQVIMTDRRDAMAPGGPLSYTIEVRNQGPASVEGASVVDVFPPELTNVTWKCTPGAGGASCAQGDNTGDIDDSANLPAGSSLIYEANAVSPAAPFVGILLNTVEVTAPSGVTDLVFSNNVAMDKTTVGGSNLAVTKDDGRDAFIALSSTYTIIVTNLGPEDVRGATVRDPSDVTSFFSIYQWTCEAEEGATCTERGDFIVLEDTIDLPAGKSVTYTLSEGLFIQLPPSIHSNTVFVETPAGTVDPDLSNNSATDITTIEGSNLAIAKSDGLEATFAGESISYDIVIENLGPRDVEGATVTDDVPDALGSVRWSCVAEAGGRCSANDIGDVDDTIDLPAGASLTYFVTGTLASPFAGTLTNTATVEVPDERDPDLSNNTATDTTEVLADPSPFPSSTRCADGATALCLLGDRFEVRVAWKDFAGATGLGRAIQTAGNDSVGVFTFFDEANVELAVKILDGSAINRHFWVFYASLTNVGFVLTVTDLESGRTVRYENPAGTFASGGDTAAFAID